MSTYYDKVTPSNHKIKYQIISTFFFHIKVTKTRLPNIIMLHIFVINIKIVDHNVPIMPLIIIKIQYKKYFFFMKFNQTKCKTILFKQYI